MLLDVFIDDLLETLHTRPKELCIPLDSPDTDKISRLTYADDANAMSLTPEGLQGHIDTIDKWLVRWRSLPNVSKSKTMVFIPLQGGAPVVFQLRGSQLETVHSYIYLGVFFQSNGS